jgi:hypothetical protein
MTDSAQDGLPDFSQGLSRIFSTFDSGQRIDSFILLSEGKTAKEVSEALDISRSTLQNYISDYKEENYLGKDGNQYQLTTVGEIVRALIRNWDDSFPAMLNAAAAEQLKKSGVSADRENIRRRSVIALEGLKGQNLDDEEFELFNDLYLDESLVLAEIVDEDMWWLNELDEPLNSILKQFDFDERKAIGVVRQRGVGQGLDFVPKTGVNIESNQTAEAMHQLESEMDIDPELIEVDDEEDIEEDVGDSEDL